MIFRLDQVNIPALFRLSSFFAFTSKKVKLGHPSLCGCLDGLPSDLNSIVSIDTKYCPGFLLNAFLLVCLLLTSLEYVG